MKKLILLLIAFAALANGAAWGQSYYYETYMEFSKTLVSKDWFSNGCARSENFNPQGKLETIVIYRPDSAKIYQIWPDKKTYMPLPLTASNDAATNMINQVVGDKVEKGRKRTKKFIKAEEVEGFACKRYDWKSVVTQTNGSTEELTGTDWVYEPLNIVIKSTNRKALPADECAVVRLLREGPQPAHLFEIPKGYKPMSLPGGGLLEIFSKGTGKTTEQTKDAFQEAKDTDAKIKSIDKNQSDAEKVKDLLKLLEGTKKKK